MQIQTYKDLIVWKKSIEVVKLIYNSTSKFPKSETYSLVDQIRRAVVSIPSNIAEGYGRKSHKEYLQFYSIAYGSSLEVEAQLIISKELNFIPEPEFNKINSLLTEVIKMLYVLTYKRG